MSSSLPPIADLNEEERRRFQEAVHTFPLTLTSPFQASGGDVFSVWREVVSHREEAWHHWREEFVLYCPTHLTLQTINERLALTQQHIAFGLPEHWTLAHAFCFAVPLPHEAWQMSLRQRTLGLHWLDVQGNLIGSGGRVLKNVTGYDLHRFHLGMQGTLGLPIGVCLRTSPLSPHPLQRFQIEGTSKESFHALLRRLKVRPPQGLHDVRFQSDTENPSIQVLWQGEVRTLALAFEGMILSPCDETNSPLPPSESDLKASAHHAEQTLWQFWRQCRTTWGIAPSQFQSPYFEQGVYDAH
jgi:hypothetical protein